MARSSAHRPPFWLTGIAATQGVDMIISIVGESLPGILSVFSLTSIVCILFSSCLWIAEGTDYSVTYQPQLYPRGVYEPTPFTSISHCFWWFFVTATTVGYGDEFPTTALGRLTAVGTFYAGIVLVAIKLTIVGRALKQSFPQWNGQVRQSSQRKTSKIRCKVGPGQQCQQSTISSCLKHELLEPVTRSPDRSDRSSTPTSAAAARRRILSR
eukprot:g3070.t1